MRLSKRLETITGLVTPGFVAADIGCDHGYVPIRLVEQGICPSAIASDVREGPLARAREHVAEHGLEGKISLRLGSGLSTINAGEADTLIMSGMGGMLMRELLLSEREKLFSFREMILSPQSDLPLFRAFLAEEGLLPQKEIFLIEDGKPYFLLYCRKGGEAVSYAKEELCFGRKPVDEGGEYLAWLAAEKEKRQALLGRLSMEAGEKSSRRREEVQRELSLLDAILQQK